MKLQAGFLAVQAMGLPDGSFMVWQGGVTNFQGPTFPTQIQFFIVLRIEFDRAEGGKLHRLSLRILHDEDEVGPLQSFPIALPDAGGQPRLYMNMQSFVSLTIARPGEGRVEIAVDDARCPHIYFTVQEGPPVLPGAPPVTPTGG